MGYPVILRKEADKVVKSFEIENLITREWHQVEAETLEEACKKVGWKVEDSYFHRANVVIPRR